MAKNTPGGCMRRRLRKLGLSIVLAAAGLAGCEARRVVPSPQSAAYRVYVTNEQSGDLTVIDGATQQVLATVPLGKRPRGIRLGADGRTLFIALSGSPAAG